MFYLIQDPYSPALITTVIEIPGEGSIVYRPYLNCLNQAGSS